MSSSSVSSSSLSSLGASALSTLTGGAGSTGTISSLGIGSGLDVNSIISKLVSLEQIPLTQLQSQASTLQTKISTFGQIQSLVATLNSTISTLADPTSWQAVTASSSNTNAITATVTPGTAPTSVNIQVQTLAQNQSTYTTAVAPSGSAVGAGTLQIQLGTWSSGSFTAGSSSPVSITVGATDTVSDIANEINSANAGVTATVVTDSTGDHLLLNGSSTGAANGFQITAGSGSASGLSSLTTGTTTTQQAQDAAATVNGIAVTSPTNTFSSAVSGVSFTALATTSSPVTVAVTADTSTMTKNIQAFVTAFNAVNDALTTVTAYDSSTSTAAILQGDSPTLNLQSSLLAAVTSQFNGGGSFSHLSDLGIQSQQGGDLTVNTTQLQAALTSSLSQVATMFDATSTSGTANGIGTTLENLTNSELDPTQGFFASENTSLTAQLNSNSADQTAVNNRVSSVQAQLTAKYSALDTQMAQLNSLNSYITQQITQWNKSTTIY